MEDHPYPVPAPERPVASRHRPDSRTYAGYTGIVVTWLFVILVESSITGSLHVVMWLLTQAALITAIVKFTKHDRRRRSALTGIGGHR